MDTTVVQMMFRQMDLLFLILFAVNLIHEKQSYYRNKYVPVYILKKFYFSVGQFCQQPSRAPLKNNIKEEMDVSL